MRRLHPVEVTAHDQAARHALPEAVAAALGELVGAAQEGLLALSVGVGRGHARWTQGGGASAARSQRRRFHGDSAHDLRALL